MANFFFETGIQVPEAQECEMSRLNTRGDLIRCQDVLAIGILNLELLVSGGVLLQKPLTLCKCDYLPDQMEQIAKFTVSLNRNKS